ncbi:MAG TPA: hypothetical protein VMV82_11255, partial [Candidatus Dormibacteraeota bacterium]|nr:hypothetical protein [Candidatus Dormibacteraeota bacterium]
MIATVAQPHARGSGDPNPNVIDHMAALLVVTVVRVRWPRACDDEATARRSSVDCRRVSARAAHYDAKTVKVATRRRQRLRRYGASAQKRIEPEKVLPSAWFATAAPFR